MFLQKLPNELIDLRDKFRQNGYDIRLVGGCVRDWLANDPKIRPVNDIDLCTDATPDEQRAIYRHYNIRHIDTGIKHGTWTVLLGNQTYEITTLRQDIETDGRHAKVEYTDDWELDLSRRDLTINAMSMTFEGVLFDPYGGADDLKAGIVRFVGDADQRIREDYLRILRWFRFHGRFAKNRFSRDDVLTEIAIQRNMEGLRFISRERVWSEFKRLLPDPNGLMEIFQIIRLDVAKHIDLPVPHYQDFHISFRRMELAHRLTRNPVSLLAAYLGYSDHMRRIADDWHLSNSEFEQGRLICEFLNERMDDPLTFAKTWAANDQQPKEWLVEALLVRGEVEAAQILKSWIVPKFPICGADLLASGMAPGPALGMRLRYLRLCWARSNFSLTRDDLLSELV